MKNFLPLLNKRRGFTLIELLIVIVILGILVVTVLLTLNPAESQRKSRDIKRMKDLGTLQAVMEQYVADGGATICDTTCTSAAAGNVEAQPCSSNWTGANLCEYIKSVPVDPRNNTTGTCADGDGVVFGNCLMVYRLDMGGSDYEINVRQESSDNDSNVAGDGGNSNLWAEVYSRVGSLMGD